MITEIQNMTVFPNIISQINDAIEEAQQGKWGQIEYKAVSAREYLLPKLLFLREKMVKEFLDASERAQAYSVNLDFIRFLKKHESKDDGSIMTALRFLQMSLEDIFPTTIQCFKCSSNDLHVSGPYARMVLDDGSSQLGWVSYACRECGEDWSEDL